MGFYGFDTGTTPIAWHEDKRLRPRRLRRKISDVDSEASRGFFPENILSAAPQGKILGALLLLEI